MLSGVITGTPLFRPKKDRIDRQGMTTAAFTPLQAADILAYDQFNQFRKLLRGEPLSLRYGFKQLDRMPGEVGHFDVANLPGLKEQLASGEFANSRATSCN